MDIYLVRHGEASAKWTESRDPGLSDLGNRQAAGTARSLQSVANGDFDLISSPLQRARQTASPLSQSLGLNVRIDAAFEEIPAPVAIERRQEWLKTIMRERWTQQAELVRAWHSLVISSLYSLGRPSVVFTHFMVLNAIVGHITGRDDIVCFLPDNASVTHIRVDGAMAELVSKGREIETVVV